MAGGVIALFVAVLVAVTVAGGSAPKHAGASTARTPAGAALVGQLTGVSQAEADAVGVGSDLAAPRVLTGEPALTFDGKPGALYIGAEFCPYCAADMWPMIVAFSRFGTFSGLQLTSSSAWDVHPSTATFSFYGSTYTSDVVAFHTVEAATTDTTGPGTRRSLEAPTSAGARLWSTYDARFGSAEGYPFLDIGNRVFLLGAGFDPSLLSGLDQSAIAARLSNPADPVTKAVVGSANYLTAAICSVTGQQPATVCRASGTLAAAKALGLS